MATSINSVKIKQSDKQDESWDKIQEKLRQTYGDAIFKSWIKQLELVEISGGKAILQAPTRLVRDWVSSHYQETMRRFWQLEDKQIHAIELVVRPRDREAPALVSQAFSQQKRPKKLSPSIIESTQKNIDTQATLASLDPRFTFDNFVVGKANELAFAASHRVAESPDVVQGCNPLFLYGGVGLGKTHLMHAIAWHIRNTNPRRKVLYLSAEKFMYQFVKALRFNETIAFKEQFRSVDVLMVDDIQFISGKESTQEEFFHTFNALIDQNKQLVLSADRSPANIDGLEDRVRSRLGWGLVTDINDTSYELRLGILQSKIEKIADVMIPDNVLEFLASRITSNIRELEGALNRVVAHSTLVSREITLSNTQEVLGDLLRANDRRLTVEDIQKAVATHYHIKVSDMHSARRSIAIARPRQVAMYLSKQLTSKSLPEIGRRFGGKDHTTVMHAVKRIELLKSSDIEMQDDVDMLSHMLQS